MRWLSPTLSGYSYPPDWLIVNDNYALSLTLALIIKEIPFFLLMSFSAMNHLQVDKTLHLGASFKYSHRQAWVKLIFPQMFGQLRLPLYAVLSYSLSVVDLSVVLGPTTPATFAVLITQWFNDADTSYRLMASSAASLLLIMVISIIAVFYLLECLIKKYSINWLVKGPKIVKNSIFKFYPAILGLSFIWLTTVSSIFALIVWSISQKWRFPDAWPALWTLKYWKKSIEQLSLALYNTAFIGICSAVIAIVLCILVLQWQSRKTESGEKSSQGKSLDRSFWILGIIYLPILIPQVSFLFGIQILLVKFQLEGLMSSLIWSHLIFVLPYCYLSLAKSYLQFDERYFHIAAMLSGSKWRAFICIKLPMLLRPIIFSFAIGFAVSVSQYLPSLYVGAGRIDTITVHSVALASGSDLRVTAVFSLWQFLLPLIVYLAAILIPQYIFRNRKGM
jgi:putative thiamine transport system permease protein